MRKHATWIALGVVALLAGVGVYFLTCWQAKKVRSRRLDFAKELLESNRAGEALDLLVAGNRPSAADEQREFGRLQIKALRQAGLIDQLRQLYYSSPDWFQDDEEASLLVARALLSNDDEATFERLCDQWEGHEQMAPQWFALRVDHLLSKGDRRGAIRLLESQRFEGKDDFARLSRLAMLNADKPEEAWRLLELAFELDPENGMLRLFRGNLLEAAGRRSEARVEYVAAFVADSTNPAMCDQLAEFYRRCGNHAAAQTTWSELGEAHTTDFIELKRAFWSRMTSPIVKEPASPPPGPWRDFAAFVAELPEDRFWDEDGFQQLKASSSLAKIRQETYWLKLFQLIKDWRRGDGSLQDLQHHLVERRRSATSSYSTDLQRALTLAITYRLQGNLSAESVVREGPRKLSLRHRFFDELDAAHYQHSVEGEKFVMPAELDALLKSDDAFAVIAMAAGWTEAAIRIDDGQLSPDAPTWAAYGMAQAYRMNRGVDAALTYAEAQPKSPTLQLLIGELHLAAGDSESAYAALQEIADERTELGMRAAFLTAMAMIDEGRLEDAETAVRGNPRLHVDTLGQETLAKIAMLRGDPHGAAKIYDAIADESFEATVYAARRAFARKEWEKAEQLTLKLLQKMPESIELRRNLRAIQGARRKNEL